MIRFAKLTDYGLVLMTVMAREGATTTHTARDLASVSRLPLPTVSKVLKQLLQSGLLVSHRGNKGGYGLAKAPAEISVADIVTAMEGPIALTDCSTDVIGLCDLEHSCPTKANQQVITRVMRAALEKVALSDLAQPMATSQLIPIQDMHGRAVPSVVSSSGRVQ